MINLDFTTTLLIQNGEIVSFSNPNETLWAMAFIKVIKEQFPTVLVGHKVNGSITINIQGFRAYAICNINNKAAEAKIDSIMEHVSALAAEDADSV